MGRYQSSSWLEDSPSRRPALSRKSPMIPAASSVIPTTARTIGSDIGIIPPRAPAGEQDQGHAQVRVRTGAYQKRVGKRSTNLGNAMVRNRKALRWTPKRAGSKRDVADV